MAACWVQSVVGYYPVTAKPQPYRSVSPPSSNSQNIFICSSSSSSSSTLNHLSLPSYQTHIQSRLRIETPSRIASNSPVLLASSDNKADPLKIMISGAPASGKGTQCQLITNKYGLVHIAAGDLLRAEIAAGSVNGKLAKEYMERGQLVPDEIVVVMVKERLLQSDAQESGWLLDGYPRSASQANAIKDFGFRPDLFILLEVSEEILVERVVGRRLDPTTGRIYHLKYSPPETEEIAARLTQRFDDTEEKVKLRLHTHHQNVGAVLSMYEDITIKVNGNVSMEDVFAQIDHALTTLIEEKSTSGSVAI